MRIAAVADLHFSPQMYDHIREPMSRVRDEADLLIIAGDITNYGKTDELSSVLNALVRLRIPIVAVLGNHDYESGQAEELIKMGVAGFGELSIEHLSLPQSPVKDYEYAPADSPLMLLLADIAAENNVPIDLHMEALPQTIPTPKEYGPPNPPELHGNIGPLENLLSHNPKAKII